MSTFATSKAGYEKMWASAELLPIKLSQVKAAAGKIMDNVHRPVFEQVESLTGVPWFQVGAILYRESDINLGTYIGNGQSLSKRTTEVPTGRGPFLLEGGDVVEAFIHGCVDAFNLQGFNKYKRSDWTIPFCLYQAEEFNGEGYQKRGINSPYVWAGTNHEQGGLFVSDGKFDASAHDSRVGVAAIIAGIAEIDATILQSRGTTMPIAPTTKAVIPTNVQAEIEKITQALEAAVQYIPMLAGIPVVGNFVAPAVPFIPIIEGALKLLEDVEEANGDPMAIVTAIEHHFAEISSAITKAKAQMK